MKNIVGTGLKSVPRGPKYSNKKSRKIPGFQFQKSRDLGWLKIPGSRDFRDPARACFQCKDIFGFFLALPSYSLSAVIWPYDCLATYESVSVYVFSYLLATNTEDRASFEKSQLELLIIILSRFWRRLPKPQWQFFVKMTQMSLWEQWLVPGWLLLKPHLAAGCNSTLRFTSTRREVTRISNLVYVFVFSNSGRRHLTMRFTLPVRSHPLLTHVKPAATWRKTFHKAPASATCSILSNSISVSN